MAPDLNSLPRSSGSNSSSRTVPTSPDSTAAIMRGQTPSPISRSGSTSIATSLQAAAAVNAGLQHEGSRRMSGSSNSRPRQPQSRRRSTVLMNLALNDPSLPSPGEMVNEGYASSYPHSISGSPVIATGDPHHNRAPSLGEIHQELEQEQEAQVNRLLHMIRTQQQQLHQLQIASGQNAAQVPVIDDSTPTSEFSMNFSSTPLPPITTPMSYSPTSRAANPRTSFDLIHRSRTPSRAASRTASPRMRATSISTEGENWTLPPRDENAFYQAETQMLTRENQMLRLRIRELERQVNEFNENSAITHEPATPSNLASSQARSISEEVEGIPSPVHQGTTKEE